MTWPRAFPPVKSNLPWLVATALALLAAVYQMVLASDPTNDYYMHVVMGNQLLGGDWPVRDFYDTGLFLMYVLSAVAEGVIGHRLLSEALVVGAALAVSAFLSFRLVHRLTGSTAAGALAAVILILAGVRGYSYPKIVVYAVAATLWWSYVLAPSRPKALALGAWAAAAFFWRPDHGVYVAIAVALAVVSAHGISRLGTVRLAQAGATAVALVTPFLVFVSMETGLVAYVKGGFVVAEEQHLRLNRHALPRWPVRTLTDVIGIEPQGTYAPVVGLRWTPDSAVTERGDVIARYGLTPVETPDATGVEVRMSEYAIANLGGLVGEPIVEDTAGINRGQGTLTGETFPFWQRWKFSHWWLRVSLFPGVGDLFRANEAAAALFYGLPLATLLLAPWFARRLPATGKTAYVAGFAGFGVVSALGLTRTPYDVRALDGVLLPAIFLGLWVAALWRATIVRKGPKRWMYGAATVVLAVFMAKTVAMAGQFDVRVGWLAGDWRSARRARGAWTEVAGLLWTRPALNYWDGRDTPPELRLARYARDCVAPSDRLLVLWFAPEIYYYSERLMANRSLANIPGKAAPGEQEMSVDKLMRYAPPIALATDALTDDLKGLIEYYPAVVEYVRREYVEEASFEDDGQHYHIFRRRDRPATGTYGDAAWPCMS